MDQSIGVDLSFDKCGSCSRDGRVFRSPTQAHTRDLSFYPKRPHFSRHILRNARNAQILQHVCLFVWSCHDPFRVQRFVTCVAI
jgi:hypothetical protein